MKITNPADKAWRTRDVKVRPGQLSVKPLAGGTTDDGLSFSLTLVRYGEGEHRFETPRHNHTYEQVRIPIEGALNYGPEQDIPQGWVSYFPAGAYYGPQRVDGGTILALQYGFGDDFLRIGRRAPVNGEAVRSMEKRGQFTGGVYCERDGGGGAEAPRDGVNAMYEETLGRKLEIPRPRYPAPILMDPEAFGWTPAVGEPGVELKLLGAFTERDLALSMVSFPGGGEHRLPSGRTQLVVALRGVLEVDGRQYPALTTLCCYRDESVVLGGGPSTQLIVITLPVMRSREAA